MKRCLSLLWGILLTNKASSKQWWKWVALVCTKGTHGTAWQKEVMGAVVTQEMTKLHLDSNTGICTNNDGPVESPNLWSPVSPGRAVKRKKMETMSSNICQQKPKGWAGRCTKIFIYLKQQQSHHKGEAKKTLPTKGAQEWCMLWLNAHKWGDLSKKERKA